MAVGLQTGRGYRRLQHTEIFPLVMLVWSLPITTRLWNKTNYLRCCRPGLLKKVKYCVQVLLVLCCPVLVSKWQVNMRKCRKITIQFERQNIGYLYIKWGPAVAQLVETLRYKSEGRGFDSRWCH